MLQQEDTDLLFLQSVVTHLLQLQVPLLVTLVTGITTPPQHPDSQVSQCANRDSNQR